MGSATLDYIFGALRQKDKRFVIDEFQYGGFKKICLWTRKMIVKITKLFKSGFKKLYFIPSIRSSYENVFLSFLRLIKKPPYPA